MYRQMLILLLIIGLGVLAIGAEKTWHLKEGSEWVDVSTEAEGEYLLAVAELKQYVATGQAVKAQKALANLKEKYPDIVGEDMEAFSKGEVFYAQKKFFKAFGQYNRFMDEFPKSALSEAALERQYEIARMFLYGQKKSVFVFKLRAYEEAAGMVEQIAERTGNAPIAKKAMKTLAQSYEDRKEFTEAYYRWSDVLDKWPSEQIGQEALLGMGRNMHASYRGPKYDASMLETAKTHYKEFSTKYGLQKAQGQGIGEIISQIDEELANKQLDIALYYERTSSVTAANLYFQRIVEDWPGSAAARIAVNKLEKKVL